MSIGRGNTPSYNPMREQMQMLEMRMREMREREREQMQMGIPVTSSRTNPKTGLKVDTARLSKYVPGLGMSHDVTKIYHHPSDSTPSTIKTNKTYNNGVLTNDSVQISTVNKNTGKPIKISAQNLLKQARTPKVITEEKRIPSLTEMAATRAVSSTHPLNFSNAPKHLQGSLWKEALNSSNPDIVSEAFKLARAKQTFEKTILPKLRPGFDKSTAFTIKDAILGKIK